MVTSVPAEGLTQVLVQLALLCAVAHLGGWVARRLRQPAVLGQVIAGVLVGPSVAGRLVPDVWSWVWADEHGVGAVVPALAALGAVFVLAVAGLELDTSLVRERGSRVAALVAGALVPGLAIGFATGWALPASFRGPDASVVGFAALIAVAMGISSPPVMAAVLGELGIAHRSFANVALSVAMATDVVGWVLLGVVVAGASGAAGALGKALVGLLALGLALALLRVLLPRWRPGPAWPSHGAIGAVVVLALAALSHTAGIEAVLGAFVAGIALRRFGSGGREVVDGLRPVVTSLLGPVFFAFAGARVDVDALGSASALAWTALLVVLASVAKVVGAGGTWRLVGRPRSESLAMGAILNVRGSLEIVLAGVGLAAGILNATSYAAVIVVALATSALATPLIRVAFGPEGLAARQQPHRATDPRAEASVTNS